MMADEHMGEREREQSRRMMTGMFRDRESAERAYGAVTGRGYGASDVSLLMSEDTRQRHFGADRAADTPLGTKAAEGAGVGAAVGGGVGALIAGLAAAGTIALPGVGLIALGPLAAALAGAAGGGVAGGLLGALIGSGIPEEQARQYERGINEGGIVMGFDPRTDEDAEYLEREWGNYRGEQIYRPSARDRAA
jgi:hypothetical protein